MQVSDPKDLALISALQDGLPLVYRDLFGARDPSALAEEARSTPFYSGLFISEDLTVAGLLVETRPDATADGRRETVEAINAAVKKLQEDMIQMQKEQASKIVTPDELRGGKNDIII